MLVLFAHAAPAAVPFDPTLPELPGDIRLPRWDEARTLLAEDFDRLDRCLADAATCAAPRHVAWRSLMRTLADQPPSRQIVAVNAFVNAVPYASDVAQYGVRDYWAGPWQFLASLGDCEDFAIAKYASLRRLGFAAADLRIVVVEDVVRGLAHAVLAVRLEDGVVWLLDNQTPEPLRATAQHRYAPYYAVNEESRWLHRLPAAAASGG